MLAESLESEESNKHEEESTTMEDETREEKLNEVIRTTTEDLIEHDKKDAVEDILDAVQEL